MTVAIVGPDEKIEERLLQTMLTEEGRQNPYGLYALLHQEAPIYKSSTGAIIFSRFDDCTNLLRHPHLGKDTDSERFNERFRFNAQVSLSDEEIKQVTQFFSDRASLLFLNPPEHTRLRSLVSRAFTPRRTQQLEPHVREITRSMLNELSDVSDIMEDVAWKLPSFVICELLGVPTTDRDYLRPFIRKSVRLVEPLDSSDVLYEGIEAIKVVDSYLSDLIAEKRKNLKDDLISALIQARDGNESLSDQELLTTCALIFAAGYETTTNLLGNGLYALLKNPGQFELLRNHPNCIKSCVEELLRYDTPVQFDGRVALCNTSYGSIELSEGDNVVTILGAANHDPSHFSNPQELNILRDEGPPLSFASGIHYCLGASLARLEGQVFFSEIITRFSKIELLENPRYRSSITIRGLNSLRVKLS